MAGTAIEVEGHVLSLSNLDKPLYPNGFTKSQVIDYYVRIAPVLLPYLDGRALTVIRYPDGSQGKSFFSKNIPSFAPEWMPRVARKDNVHIVCSNLATLVFLANLAALELHVPLHRRPDRPTVSPGRFLTLTPDRKPGSTNAVKWR